MDRVLNTYELLERILAHVDNICDIIRSRLVCHRWKTVIDESPTVQLACWYRAQPAPATPRKNDQGQSVDDRAKKPAWRLNPVFNALGLHITTEDPRGTGTEEENVNFDMRKRIYDKPGSWESMLATQPPTQLIEVACWGEKGDNMFYLVESLHGPILVGDVMAVLAECQHRRDAGMGPWAGARQETGQLYPVTGQECAYEDWSHVIRAMPADVHVNVAVLQAWSSGIVPGFSLRRLRQDDGTVKD
ncbi:hypothetical protein OQA88_4618 [Cercophora sp. LCS_1]